MLLSRSLRLSRRFHAFVHDPPVPLHRQSVLLPGEERVRASALLRDPERPIWKIPDAEHVDSCFKLLQFGHTLTNDGDCIGSRPSPDASDYKWLKYSEVISLSQQVGSGLVELGLGPSSLVGVFATNREELLLTMCGCAAYSLVSVPLYPQMALPSLLFVLQQGKIEVVVCDSASRARVLLEHAQKLPALQTIVCMDLDGEDLELGGTPKVISFQQLQEKGRSNPKPLRLPGPNDLFSIPYTSGTTGNPKGVMLTHQNLVACVASLRMSYGAAGSFGGTIISYLPPAHIYEIANMLVSLFFGRRLAFYKGDIRQVMEEVRRVKPTILPLVPRLMNPLYAKAMSDIRGNWLKARLLDTALKSREKRVLRWRPRERTWLDRLMFDDFRASLGGEAHMVISTSAPLAPHVMAFFRRASSAYLIECYGQTEMLGATQTLPNDIQGGSVGPPLPCNHLKLVDVPEMGHFAKDDVGEICVRGTNVFQGYYKHEGETSLVDGWQHTGDVGRWLKDGTLQVIDRKKHIFKLSQGEYIAPEKVEGAYIQSELVAQIFVDGIPTESYAVALVVPEVNAFSAWLAAAGHQPSQLPSLLERQEVKREFLRELHRVGERLHLNRLEQVRGVALLLEPFGPHLTTPTHKLKRLEARREFQETISALYREGPLL